jgi:hypothetical protein
MIELTLNSCQCPTDAEYDLLRRIYSHEIVRGRPMRLSEEDLKALHEFCAKRALDDVPLPFFKVVANRASLAPGGVNLLFTHPSIVTLALKSMESTRSPRGGFPRVDIALTEEELQAIAGVTLLAKLKSDDPFVLKIINLGIVEFVPGRFGRTTMRHHRLSHLFSVTAEMMLNHSLRHLGRETIDKIRNMAAEGRSLAIRREKGMGPHMSELRCVVEASEGDLVPVVSSSYGMTSKKAWLRGTWGVTMDGDCIRLEDVPRGNVYEAFPIDDLDSERPNLTLSVSRDPEALFGQLSGLLAAISTLGGPGASHAVRSALKTCVGNNVSSDPSPTSSGPREAVFETGVSLVSFLRSSPLNHARLVVSTARDVLGLDLRRVVFFTGVDRTMSDGTEALYVALPIAIEGQRARRWSLVASASMGEGSQSCWIVAGSPGEVSVTERYLGSKKSSHRLQPGPEDDASRVAEIALALSDPMAFMNQANVLLVNSGDPLGTDQRDRMKMMGDRRSAFGVGSFYEIGYPSEVIKSLMGHRGPSGALVHKRYMLNGLCLSLSDAGVAELAVSRWCSSESGRGLTKAQRQALLSIAYRGALLRNRRKKGVTEQNLLTDTGDTISRTVHKTLVERGAVKELGLDPSPSFGGWTVVSEIVPCDELAGLIASYE